jgi:uncharacterized protein
VRIVLDTNVIVSAMLSPTGPPARLLAEIRDRDDIGLITAEPLLDEYRRALSYPHVQRLHRLSSAQIDATVDALRFQASIVGQLPDVKIVESDPDDDLIISCAVGGNADVIVSGDRHLLRVKAYREIVILSPAACLMAMSTHSQG